MSDTLFDPNVYGNGKPVREKVRVEVVLEPVGAGWTLVSTRRGIDHYQHAIKSTDPHYAAARMECDLVGRQFSPAPGQAHLWKAERCPSCLRELEAK